MRSKALSTARALRTRGSAAAVVSAILAVPGLAAVPGFTEDFAVPSGTFFSGATLTHVASGGVGGAGDGYLSISEGPFPGNLGAASQRFEIVGDLVADGVTGYSFWLNDIGGDQPLEIHVGVGTAFVNFWLYQPGFSPPENGWSPFTVDFSNPADWVQTQGSGTFQDALMASNRLLFRHDLAPFSSNPDPIVGEFGLDRVKVLPEPASMTVLALGALAATRRRR